MSASWIVADRLLAMAAPWPEDLPELSEMGVVGLISLTSQVPPGVAEAGLRHLHLPVRDFHPPTQGQLRAASDFIDAGHVDGGAIAVHCAAGLGRTGTICAAWLTTQGRTAEAAIREVRSRRPGSVETRAQAEAIALFAEAGSP